MRLKHITQLIIEGEDGPGRFRGQTRQDRRQRGRIVRLQAVDQALKTPRGRVAGGRLPIFKKRDGVQLTYASGKK